MPRSKARKAKSEVVIDTSCLACLLHLDLLEKLIYRYEIIRIPRRVWNEVYDWNEERRRREKKPSIYRLQSLLRQTPTSFKRCYVIEAFEVELLIDRKRNQRDYIDRGEAEVIIQARELQKRGHNVSEVLIDERKGTKIARRYGLKARATGGVLALLKRDRIIEEDVRSLLEKCRDEIQFRIDEKDINQVLKEYGVK